MSQPQSTTLDGLPKRFVLAMRKLFDILDDKKTGYVKFSDIEQWWQDDGTKGLPKGVIDSLHKVTPQNGLLSFERFCAGLKICLLRNQVEMQKVQNKQQILEVGKIQPKRPPSAPVLDIPENTVKMQWTNTATVRPNNAIAGQRTNSMPQLVNEQKDQPNVDARNHLPHMGHMNQGSNILYGPPKPPRTAQILERAGIPANSERNQNIDRVVLSERNIDKAEIRTALQNWQKGILLNDTESGKAVQDYGMNNVRPRSSGDGKSAGYGDVQANMHKKIGPRKREPRRHTLQNGIDYNMLKRIKQIEQEKDVLMQGLSAVERAREWYLKQVAIVQEKMKYLGRVGSHAEQWSEAQAEKLELQKARVLEVNRHLATLTESWERGGLPLHMNLAVHHVAPTDIVARVKHQNRLLTKEVSQKSERITLLEQEKASLLRELYQTRSLLQSRPMEVNNIHDHIGFM
ncbi:UNVERIFIED_CONTAM: hypothetical protein PYX00_001669 [Menopon gallinae]|uniref:Suppressor APC domain-containing protein n=1 Tax=Menopon gallinae TaxID=328185 RepID=A0AAW2IDK8_9NEOP